jgi:hypothetical protein
MNLFIHVLVSFKFDVLVVGCCKCSSWQYFNNRILSFSLFGNITCPIYLFLSNKRRETVAEILVYLSPSRAYLVMKSRPKGKFLRVIHH